MFARVALGFGLVLLAGASVAQVPAPDASAVPAAQQAPSPEQPPTQPPAQPQQPAQLQPPSVAAVGPSVEVVEKLASGDRAFLAGDLRAALFAYQDAVYAQPAYLQARVKLGRTYLAMRYPEFATAQAEAVLKVDPANPDAQAVLEEARRMPPRAVAASPASEATRGGPRSFKLTPESATPGATTPGAAGGAAAGGLAGAVAAVPTPAREPAAAPAPTPAPTATPAPPAQTAAQRYRTGVERIGSRDYTGAVAELSEAIALDPRMAVAYAARASARFGLGRYRESADDYKAALGLDPGLGTPLYGLAECYRQLGDPAAVDMYRRYADSKAPDVREDLRAIATQRAAELSGK